MRKSKQETDEQEIWNHTDWERKWMNKSGRMRKRPAVFVGRPRPLCASLSEKLRYPSGLPLSVLDSGSTEGPFQIRSLLPLAQLQIKAHSEGDSSAHRPPLGNGWDGPMNAFVEGKSRARRSRTEADREELNKEWGKKEENTHIHTNNLRQPDTSSIGGPVGTHLTFVQCVL